MLLKQFIVQATQEITEAIEELNIVDHTVGNSFKFEPGYGISFEIPINPTDNELHVVDKNSPINGKYAVAHVTVHPVSTQEKYRRKEAKKKMIEF